MIINNQYRNIQPYRARNMIMKKLEVQSEPPTQNKNVPQPSSGQETDIQPSTDEVGYINVGVYTASGALPVKDAVVTVYHTYNEGEEHVLYNLVTDESGRVPIMEMPIEYSGPDQQTEYDYSTYNLRVQAIGYYNHNILDIQIYPNISTNFRINLIPVAQGGSPDGQEQTIVIPPRPYPAPLR